MSSRSLSFVFLGLSITSSWGNGHATTYRGLIRELAKRGHRILFLERDVPWYRGQRDLQHPHYCRLEFYGDLAEHTYAHRGAQVDQIFRAAAQSGGSASPAPATVQA